MGLIASAALAATQPVPATGPDIEGTWLTDEQSEITVMACPDDFCGNITKIVVPDQYKQNKAAMDIVKAGPTDLLNKDPSLRKRPILGLQILTLHPNKDKPKIYDGQIYDPQDGNTYSGYVEVVDHNHIRLNGCILYNIICKGQDWTRAPDQPAGTPPSAGTASSGSGAAAGSFQ